ncbi:MAG: hypothetical protein LBS74_08375 [Oscillospiraceae bacterium]|jgi:hypothetical protein|nr:hypothetical protein [Oscillospiraceae bacterium]
MTIKQKGFLPWLSNLWYHYKWQILLCSAALIVGIICISSFFTQKSFDYNVAYIGSDTLADTQIEAFSKALAVYGEDIDKDGKVKINLQSYFIQGDGIAQSIAMADQMLVQNDVDSGSSVIFILNKASYEHCQAAFHCFGYRDGSPAPDTAEIEELGVLVNGTSLFTKLADAGINGNGLYIVLRSREGLKESDLPRLEAAIKLVDKLTGNK